jgi:putative ABC transport system permease protein
MDVRHGARALAARPSFTASAVLTLALGLGVTTAVVSVVATVVLAPPPYAHPATLVQVARVENGRRPQLLPAADVQSIREATTMLSEVGVAGFRDVALGGVEAPERVRGVIVTAGTLRMLGVTPSAGRLPADALDVRGGACVAILSHRISTDRFTDPADAIGNDVRIDGAPCTVLAVMPPGFAFPAPWFAPGDVWLLAGPSRIDWTAASGPGFLVFARLAPGNDLAAARAELDAIAVRAATTRPELASVRFTAMAYAAPSREASRTRLLTLLAAAALVLMIACVNVVNLQLARSADRHVEMATRAALGASRSRLMRQLLTEDLVLFSAAAIAGLLVAAWSLDLIVGLRSYFIPRMEEAAIDGVALAVCFGMALVAGVGAGLFPALRVSDLDSGRRLRAVGRGATAGPHWRRFQRALISIETAFALMLLGGAALLLQSYARLSAIDPGFRTENVLHARVTPPAGRYPDRRELAAFYQRVQERAANAPGVLALTLTDVPPGVGAGAEQPFAIAGETPAGVWPRTAWRAVSETYFRTLEIPVLRGGFEQHTAEPRIAIVNEQFVREYLGGRDPIGLRLHLASSQPDALPETEAWTIVGLAADAREESTWRAPPPTVYVRFTDRPAASMAILARTATAPLAAANALQTAIASIDPDQPIYGLRALDFIMASELDLNRLGMTLLALFAGLAFLLAVAGIHGVVAHTAGQRLHEIGLRIALGALPADVLRLLVGECARYSVLGVATGLGLSFALAGRLASVSPGWAGTDARVLMAAAMIVLAAALLSAFLPARRAATLDPLQILRRE